MMNQVAMTGNNMVLVQIFLCATEALCLQEMHAYLDAISQRASRYLVWLWSYG